MINRLSWPKLYGLSPFDCLRECKIGKAPGTSASCTRPFSPTWVLTHLFPSFSVALDWEATGLTLRGSFCGHHFGADSPQRSPGRLGFELGDRCNKSCKASLSELCFAGLLRPEKQRGVARQDEYYLGHCDGTDGIHGRNCFPTGERNFIASSPGPGTVDKPCFTI